jgi:hypothetical protein
MSQRCPLLSNVKHQSLTGHAVAYMVEALCYKPEGHGFNSQGVIGFFNSLNPSGCNMALGSTQPLTEMNTTNLPGG